MIAIPIMIAVAAGLVGIYMLRPQFRRKQISAARFLRRLDPPQRPAFRLSLSIPRPPLPFYLQLSTVLLLLAALLSEWWGWRDTRAVPLGLWLLLDTSYSMSTRQGSERWAEAAQRQGHAAIDQAMATATAVASPCFRISAFDVEVRTVYEGSDTEAAHDAIGTLQPRAAATNLGLVRAVAEPTPDDKGCHVTHVLVVSDMPAPAIPRRDAPRVVWSQVGVPVVNVGIADVITERNPLNGRVESVRVDVETSQGAAAGAEVRILGPAGQAVALTPRDWKKVGRQRVRFTPSSAGTYQIRVDQGGAYDGDDWAEIEIPEQPEAFTVACSPSTCAVAEALGWQVGSNASLVITDDFADVAGRSGLVLGRGYRWGEPSDVVVFNEGHPVLDGINFDVADRAGMAASARELPPSFVPLLRGGDGNVWVAARGTPQAVYVPGPPTLDESKPEASLSAAMFFNAVRWLLEETATRAVPYRLRTPDGEEIQGSIEEHPGESPRRSAGEITDITPLPSAAARAPLWPYFVLVAAAIWLVDRLLVAATGSKWI